MTDRDEIAAHIPRLRRYARALAGDSHPADDLVQDTIERALTKFHLWRHGSDLRACGNETQSGEMSNITEIDLHAYADGQLDDSRRVQVEAYLANEPAAAESVRVWREQNEALRALYNPVLNEPIPQRLLAARVPRRRWPSFALAAGVIGLGFALGWLSHGHRTDRFVEAAALPRRAAVAYAVYAPEVRHPVEVGADQQDHLVKWLSKRLGNDLKVPLLTQQGFDLVGGRLLPGGKGPVAQFMYQDATRQRITLYVSLRDADSRDTAFRFSQEDRIAVFYWIDGKLGYALSGEMDRARLLAVATVVYRQINP